LRRWNMRRNSYKDTGHCVVWSCTAVKSLFSHITVSSICSLAGAGGLGTGLDQSGFVETRWAVEFSPSAALTYQ
jgi:hypothetical protein